MPIFEAIIIVKPKKCQNTYTKAQLERPKHLQQTTFERLKFLP